MELFGVFPHDDPAAAAAAAAADLFRDRRGPRSRVYQRGSALLDGVQWWPGPVGSCAGKVENSEKNDRGPCRGLGGGLSIAPQLQNILDRFLRGRPLEAEMGPAGCQRGGALTKLAADVRAAGQSDSAIPLAARDEADLTAPEPTSITKAAKTALPGISIVDDADTVNDISSSAGGENQLLAAICELHKRMLDAWRHCAICDWPLPSGGDWCRRPMVCGSELCRFQLVQLGLGADCTDRVDTWDKVNHCYGPFKLLLDYSFVNNSGTAPVVYTIIVFKVWEIWAAVPQYGCGVCVCVCVCVCDAKV